MHARFVTVLTTLMSGRIPGTDQTRPVRFCGPRRLSGGGEESGEFGRSAVSRNPFPRRRAIFSTPRTHKFAHHPNLLPFLSSKISTKYPPTPRSRPFLLPSSPSSRLTTEKKLNLLHFPSPSRCKHYREKMLENHLDHPRPSISSVSRPSTPSSPRPPPPCIIFVVELLPRSSIPLSVVSPFLTSSDSSPPLFLRLAVRTFP